MPSWWFAAVARLLSLVEQQRRWPPEWLHAYVAMVPKSSGGVRPQDQRPITALELVYRVWAKGTIVSWSPTLEQFVLSDAAFGFGSLATRCAPCRPGGGRPHSTLCGPRF